VGKMLEVWKMASLSEVPDTPPLQHTAQIEQGENCGYLDDPTSKFEGC